MRAGRPNLGKEWEQVAAVDYWGGGISSLVARRVADESEP